MATDTLANNVADSFDFSQAPLPPLLLNPRGCPTNALGCPAATAITGVPYASSTAASGGVSPYSFLLTAGTPPPGLAFNNSTGVLTGTPTTPGTFSFTPEAVDSNGNAAANFCKIAVSGVSSHFTLTSSPDSVTVTPGNSGTSTITTAVSGGFSSAISLSATGAPSGTTVSFNPSSIAAPGGGTSTMTIAVGSSTAVGTYTIRVTGTGGGITQSTTITLAVGTAIISYVQGNDATPQTTEATVSVTFTAAQAAGDLNVVVVGWNDTTAVVNSVTDTSGNTYALAVGPTIYSSSTQPFTQSIYYAKNIAAATAGANSVTVTFSTAAAYPDIRILEYSGADPNNPVDVTAGSSGSSATSSSGSATTTNPTDLIFGANIVWTYTTGPGSGFTQRLLTQDGDIVEDRMVKATGSYSATTLLGNSGAWVMQMVAFR